MMHSENHCEARELTLKIVIGSQLIIVGMIAFGIFALSIHYPKDFTIDWSLQISYWFVTSAYVLTSHQFIFMTASIKSRFELLNMNIM